MSLSRRIRKGLARRAPRLAVPWDYSRAPAKGEPTMDTVESPEAAELGRVLARLCDEEEAEQLERFPNLQPRCSDCAFREGTLPNRCEDPLFDAIKCVVDNNIFYCHKGLKDGQPKRPCAGFMLLASNGRPRQAILHLARSLQEAAR